MLTLLPGCVQVQFVKFILGKLPDISCVYLDSAYRCKHVLGYYLLAHSSIFSVPPTSLNETDLVMRRKCGHSGILYGKTSPGN